MTRVADSKLFLDRFQKEYPASYSKAVEYAERFTMFEVYEWELSPEEFKKRMFSTGYASVDEYRSAHSFWRGAIKMAAEFITAFTKEAWDEPSDDAFAVYVASELERRAIKAMWSGHPDSDMIRRYWCRELIRRKG